MKVFLSVDMEGISGLVRWADVVTRGMDYQRNRRFMIGASIYLLLMHWLDHFWVIMPQIGFNGKDFAPFAFSFVELLCFIGLGGLYIAIFSFIASNRPLVPLRDPRLSEALNYTNT